MSDSKTPESPTKEQVDNKEAEDKKDKMAYENDSEKGDNEPEKCEKNENEENEKNAKNGSIKSKKKIKTDGDAEGGNNGEYTEEELAELEAIEKENKNDCYYVLLAIVLGMGLFGVLVYFSVQSFFLEQKIPAAGYNASLSPPNTTMIPNTTITDAKTTTTSTTTTTAPVPALFNSRFGGDRSALTRQASPMRLAPQDDVASASTTTTAAPTTARARQPETRMLRRLTP
ncbi:uncharacterized protein LOC106158130 [Lingula anatina]|uniref:Uncharacterized protein LOC106158130 n=1 Tax=Lingula anatina TaxID=7574 RepID=A0A1S3HTV3_LINAN|nr:uncharacterized protein LOC106158130 [Lingula anatina]|eukprot:XP_013389475.1 uncharacterized protein LOC106158130 [Lingula anatina]